MGVGSVRFPSNLDVRRTFVIALVAVMTLLTIACSVFGVRSEREPDYGVLLQDGNREIREYSSYLIARTQVEGDYDEASSRAFRILFDYISGNNQSRQEITMTVPVTQARDGEEVAMTAPVSQEREPDGWTMSFVLPSSYTMDSAPKPVDPSIRIEEVPSKAVAVLTYSGLTSPEKLDRLSNELAGWIETQGYRTASQPRSAHYDPPFTIPFLRRSEVHIDVEKL